MQLGNECLSLQLAQRTENSRAVSSSHSFWDWEKGEKLDYFHNGNPRYTRITAMEYLNGQDCSLLLTATGEGHSVPPWGLGTIPVQLSCSGPLQTQPDSSLPALPCLLSAQHPFPGSNLQVLPGSTEISQAGAAKTFQGLTSPTLAEGIPSLFLSLQGRGHLLLWHTWAKVISLVKAASRAEIVQQSKYKSCSSVPCAVFVQSRQGSASGGSEFLSSPYLT